MTDLEKQLGLVALLADQPMSSREVQKLSGVTRQTVTRMIGELRHLGVDIVSERRGGRSCYVIRNWSTIGPRVMRWLELEQKQRELLAETDGQRNLEL